jgi:hypothetical protein
VNTPPRILLIMADQWERSLTRAALREVGYDAVGARDVSEARRYRAVEPGRGAVGVVVADHDAAAKNAEMLNDIVAMLRGPPVILVARVTQNPPPGAWTRVIRRPLSVADLVGAVQSALPLPEESRRPVDVEGE